MEKFEQSRVSENEDDPEIYESSGDEWNEEVEEKKGGNRRSSQRLSKKPRVSHTELDSDSDADGKKKSKNGIKRQKLDEDQEPQDEDIEDEEDLEEEEEEEDDDEEEESAESQTNNKSTPKKTGSSKGSEFVNGGFLILKKDVESGNKNLCLWRIDGKALLQKYEPFDEDGQTRHRNTSIYTGWSSLDKDLYYPVVVKVLRHQGQNMTVELNWKLEDMQNESE